MKIEEILYTLGEKAENIVRKTSRAIHFLFLPGPSAVPPRPGPIERSIKRVITPHELASLRLQLSFLTYLIVGLFTVFLGSWVGFVLLSVIYFLYLRAFFIMNGEFFIEYGPYRSFYLGLSVIAAAAYGGYLVIRELALKPLYLYLYLVAVSLVVVIFRYWFKSKYGRDFTYGVVEEVKNDLVRVFVHDDIAANVKPGYYWVPKVEDAEPGRVVKLLVESGTLKSSRPVRIIEVYIGNQSSQTETEPKEEIE
jgi:uncharacterized membrane protein